MDRASDQKGLRLARFNCVMHCAGDGEFALNSGDERRRRRMRINGIMEE